MPKFAANLTLLFTELPFADRFQAAAKAGFDGVEILFPYDEDANGIAARLAETGLPLALINTPPGDWARGERGVAAVPGGEERFRADFARCLGVAEKLKPQHIHIMSGNTRGPEARETFLRNLAWAADQAPDQSLTIEPINGHDMPDYFLNDYDLAAGIIADVDRPNLRLQYDTYHAQRITGDAVACWDAVRDIAVHVQVGSFPDRHEPETGPVAFPAFFDRLDAEGYAGWVSGEYNPAGRTGDGLGWLMRG